MGDLISTLAFPGAPELWGRYVQTVPTEGRSPLDLARELWARATPGSGVILNGSTEGYRDWPAAHVLARRHGVRVILTDCTWKRGVGWGNRLLRRLVIQRLDRPNVTFCVLSEAERRLFARNWGLARAQVARTPWSYGLPAHDLTEPTWDEGFVFAGGDSLRDYETLLRAVAGLGLPVRIASRTLEVPDPPPNVTIRAVNRPEFRRLSRAARVVVVPLQAHSDRSAGQCTYLDGMVLGKPVIASDTLGVREYVEHGRTGLVVPPGDPAALREAIAWAIAPEHAAEVRAMGARARAWALGHFGPEQYARRLLSLALGGPIP